MHRKPPPPNPDLRRRAEASLKKRSRGRPARPGGMESVAENQRLIHELQVHQIELELQNSELQESRDRTALLLEKYTDLFDFAPAGYFTLNEQGRILEVNLTGAALLGVERSRLIARALARFVASPFQPAFLLFLEQVFAHTDRPVCELKLVKEDGTPFWASLHGGASTPPAGPQMSCRIAVSDITTLRQAQEDQRLAMTLAVSNAELKQEIVRRQSVEKALTSSEQHQSELLEQSQHMQKQLRSLSHGMLHAREAERKHISRELHDDVAQNLVGINILLEALAQDPEIDSKSLRLRLRQIQRLVRQSVSTVHRFAVELRPSVLDDLGLIPALRNFLGDFMKRTGIRVYFKPFAEPDPLDGDQRTTLYRIVQAALANVAQHSHASRVKMGLRIVDNSVRLEIADNGKAFTVPRGAQAGRGKHLGLLGMRERVEMINGSLSVLSRPGKGTTLVAQIPLRRRNPKTHTGP